MSPSDGTNLTYKNATFSWRWDGTLAANQSFEIRIWQGSEPHYGAFGAVLTKQEMVLQNGGYILSFDVTGSYSVNRHNNGEYFWSVAVVEIEPSYRDIGIESDPRSLRINAFGGGNSSRTSPLPTPKP